METLRDHKFRLVSFRTITTEDSAEVCSFIWRRGPEQGERERENLNLKKSKTKVRSKNLTKTFSIAKPSSEGPGKDANGKTLRTKTNSY